MSSFTDTKDPDSVRAESIDWSAEMALTSPADSIFSSSWSADNGLVVDSNSKSGAVTSCVISGGRLGAYCNLTNHIVTTADYEYDASISVEVVNA